MENLSRNTRGQTDAEAYGCASIDHRHQERREGGTPDHALESSPDGQSLTLTEYYGTVSPQGQ